jgi:flagellar motor switch protein FliN
MPVASTLDTLSVEIMIVLGQTKMPIHKVLRMGRGAVVAFDPTENDEVEIHANNLPIARGQVLVNNGDISIEITELLRRPSAVPAISG